MSNYWLDQVVSEVLAQHPDGEIVVASGHSPSGQYHIGTLRELITADAIRFQLKQEQTGREITHIDFVDDFDALRKVPEGLPKEYEKYIGKPLSLVPSPDGDKEKSYADYYLEQFYEQCEKLDISHHTIERRRSHRQYQEGKFATYIEKTLENLEEIKKIIERVSHRELSNNWAPVQILSDDGYLNKWEYAGWDKDDQVVFYRDESGDGGQVSYTGGRVKLDWRLDWPARWHLLGVSVEPFGRDHASKGGSYDTGKALVRRIFDGTAPTPVPYEFVRLAGDSKKLSKSKGDVITPEDVLSIMPAEVLRYFMVRSRASKELAFDPGEGLYNLIDEYSKVKHAISCGEETEFKEAYLYASKVNRDSHDTGVITGVPFKHLVHVYQASKGDSDIAKGVLKRTGYDQEELQELSVLGREFEFVENWLEEYAPEDVKFDLQDTVPEVELSNDQKDFLSSLAGALEQNQDLEGEWVHQTIYEKKDEFNLSPKQAFQAIYKVLLGKKYGPQAGDFLALISEEIDKDWLIKRLKRQA